MTWDAHHRRTHVLREILDAAAQRSSSLSLDDLLDSVPGARDELADASALALATHMHWAQRLSGALDLALGDGLDDARPAVVEAWADAALAAPGARRVLDAAEDDPALAAALAKERVLLAVSAGRVHDLDLEGARLRAEGQALAADRTSSAPVVVRGLFERLRSALAA